MKVVVFKITIKTQRKKNNFVMWYLSFFAVMDGPNIPLIGQDGNLMVSVTITAAITPWCLEPG